MENEFENKPVVGVHKVDPRRHLHLTRPDVTKLVKNDAQSVPMIKARLEKNRHCNRIYLLLEEGCKGHGEFLLADILNGDRRHLL